MLLHLAPDEKFIDAARVSFEKAAPGQNTFVIVGQRPLRYVRSFEPERRTLREALDASFLDRVRAADAVFIHSLNGVHRIIVDRLGPSANTVWLGWGFDYYHLICDPDALLLPLTRERARSWALSPLTRALRTVRQEASELTGQPPGAALGGIVAKIGSRRLGPGGRSEMSMLRNIGRFAPVLAQEDRLVRARHPDFAPAFASWNYPVHHLLHDAPTRSAQRDASLIVIGNSATPECNHLDAFRWVLESGLPGQIVCPLSYGNDEYGRVVIEAGRQAFGDRFRPLLDYMPTDDYVSLMSASSHLLMAHRRQQGLGNILMTLQAGAQVVLRRENPLFDALTEIGLHIAAFDDAGATRPKPEAQTVLDREILQRNFGAARHHERTRALLEACRMSAAR